MGNIIQLKLLVSFILLVSNLANGFIFIFHKNIWSREVIGSKNNERVYTKDWQNEIFYVSDSFPNDREAPPNAIADLRLIHIGSVEPYDLIANLKWTAPSSSPETPNTKVETYEIKYNESLDDLLSNFDSCPDAPLFNDLQAVPPGEEMNVNISLPNGLKTQFCIAVRAVGLTGLKGDLSNVVYTKIIPSPDSTPESATTQTTIFLQPPDRISDLVLESSTGGDPMNLYSRLTWTAPSASPETPDAKVERYEIKYNETEKELNDQFDNCLDVKIVNNSIIQPVPPGKTIAVDVFIESGASGSYFIAIKAIGTYGAKSEVSIIVKTIAEEMTSPITTTSPISNSTESPAPPSTLSEGAIIGISLGAVALLCLITASAVFLYMNKKSKNKKQEDNIYQEDNIPRGRYSFRRNPPDDSKFRFKAADSATAAPPQNYPASVNTISIQKQTLTIYTKEKKLKLVAH